MAAYILYPFAFFIAYANFGIVVALIAIAIVKVLLSIGSVQSPSRKESTSEIVGQVKSAGMVKSSSLSTVASSSVVAGSALSSIADSTITSDDINPATGLPMTNGIGSVDVAGNPYGTDLSDTFENSSSIFDDSINTGINDSFSSGFDDNFSSSFDDNNF